MPNGKGKGQRAEVKGTWRNPLWVAFSLTLLLSACAPKAPPSLPAALRHPDFVYPTVPGPLAGTAGAERIERGWRFLQNDDLRNADREFGDATRRNPSLYPAQTGFGYVLLARGDYQRSLGTFELALARAPMYVPALVGRGQALLGLLRDGEALAVFEAVVAADPSLADLRRRIDVLRFRGVQDLLETGRRAVAAGRLDEAKSAYERALAASPDSALVLRELGIVERRQGNAEGALAHLRRATLLDPSDVMALVQTAEILEQRQDFAGAETAFRAANTVEPSAELAARAAAAALRARDSRLPAQFQAIARLAQATRGDLAALIGVRLEDTVRAAAGREEVLTDIGGHWASPWITQVARAGIVEAFENHTFQPGAPLRRVDLAAAVSKVLSQLAAARPDLRARIAQRPSIADVAATHLSYPHIAAAVAAGIVPLIDGNRFEVTRTVPGVEAVEAIERLRALAVLPR